LFGKHKESKSRTTKGATGPSQKAAPSLRRTLVWLTWLGLILGASGFLLWLRPLIWGDGDNSAMEIAENIATSAWVVAVLIVLCKAQRTAFTKHWPAGRQNPVNQMPVIRALFAAGFVMSGAVILFGYLALG
jgi:hypothetical protein